MTIQLVKQLIYILTAAVVLVPVILVLFVSFKTRTDMVKISSLLLPPQSRLTLENFQRVLSNKYTLIGFKNTGTTLVVNISFNIMLGTITVFIIERSQLRFKDAIIALFFIDMLILSPVTKIARLRVINDLNLYNTLGTPIIIYMTSDLMQLYIRRQFISTLPASLDESVLPNGRGYFGLFIRIVFLLLAPATTTAVIAKAINIINGMYIPYPYMPKNELHTLTTFLIGHANTRRGSWQSLAAGIIIIMLPIILIYSLFQRYTLAGIAVGAVKE